VSPVAAGGPPVQQGLHRIADEGAGSGGYLAIPQRPAVQEPAHLLDQRVRVLGEGRQAVVDQRSGAEAAVAG
jgi:hypothetical protein